MMEQDELQRILEAALLAYGKPLTLEKLQALFICDSLAVDEQELPDEALILSALAAIQESCAGRGFELQQVSSGWRFRIRQSMAPWVSRLWQEKPPRYSRALLETLAIIAYRQPITRGDLEAIRGVAVSSSIINTLVEREWIKVVGQRDVPGRPSLYATTRQFLDYFNLQSLDQLPSLQELTDIDALTPELNLKDNGIEDSTNNHDDDKAPAELNNEVDDGVDSEVDSEADTKTEQEQSSRHD